MFKTNSPALKARNILLSLFVVLTILDIVLVAVSQDLWAIGRILVTMVVMYHVLQGKKWAKWLLVGIFSLVIVLLMALIMALHAKLSTFLVVGSLLMIMLCLVTNIFMIGNQNLKCYFAALRQI